MFGILILSTAIGVGSTRGPASEKEDALKALAKATYIQTGVNKQVKELEKEYVPEELRKYGGVLTGIAKAINEKKVSFEWTF